MHIQALSPRLRKIITRPGLFTLQVLKGFRANQGLLLSGAVAYYSLLSLIPFFILLMIILSHFIGQDFLLTSIRQSLEIIVPGQSDALVKQVTLFLEHRDVVGWLLGLVLFFFSTIAFSVLEKAMSVIFYHRVAIKHRRFLISAIIPYLFIMFLGIGFLIVVIIASILQAVGNTYVPFFGLNISLSGFSHVMLYLIGLSGQILVLTSIYIVMPVGFLSWRKALLGGITAGLLWEVVRHMLVWYFSTISLVSVVYGSLTTVIITLLSIEIAAMILLLGAQIISEYERFDTDGEASPPHPFHT